MKKAGALVALGVQLTVTVGCTRNNPFSGNVRPPAVSSESVTPAVTRRPVRYIVSLPAHASRERDSLRQDNVNSLRLPDIVPDSGCPYNPPGMPLLYTVNLSDAEAAELRERIQPGGGELIENGVVEGQQEVASADPPEQWALDNPGGILASGDNAVAGVDIGARCAWSRLATVASNGPPLYALVVDSGPADIPALHGVFSLPAGAPGGAHGEDFIDGGDHEPFVLRGPATMLPHEALSSSHGTMTAGLIAARAMNPPGLSGALGPFAGSRFFLAAARVLGDTQGGEPAGRLDDVFCAMRYGAVLAQWMRAVPGRGRLVALNLSLSLKCPLVDAGPCPTAGQVRAFDQAAAALAAQDVLVVVAAGDHARDGGICNSPLFPSTSNEPNVLAVAGCSSAGRDRYCSDPQRVPVAAPGEHLPASDIRGLAALCSGTSCAAPLATAVAMMTAAMNPSLSAVALRARLIDSALPLTSLQGAVSAGLVNACRAIDQPLPRPRNHQ